MIEVEEATPAQLPAIEEFYAKVGYIHGPLEGDRFIVAMASGIDIIGVARCNVEEGVTVLRGMFLLPEYHRVGLGTRMLKAFVEKLAGSEAWVIAYRHLVQFYQQAGFGPVDPQDSPPFLYQRLLEYREEGSDVILMRRSHHTRWTPAYGP